MLVDWNLAEMKETGYTYINFKNRLKGMLPLL